MMLNSVRKMTCGISVVDINDDSDKDGNDDDNDNCDEEEVKEINKVDNNMMS